MDLNTGVVIFSSFSKDVSWSFQIRNTFMSIISKLKESLTPLYKRHEVTGPSGTRTVLVHPAVSRKSLNQEERKESQVESRVKGGICPGR